MCIITATAVATALGLSTAAATAAAGTAAVSTAGVIAGVANVALAVGAVATIAGTALGSVGAYQQGQAAAAQNEYQAKVARDNAKIAENNAAMERQAGLEEARRQRMKAIQAIGSQKVALAANGVDVGEGTSLDIIEDTSMLGELDALMIETEGERKARNYEIQANNFINDANLSDFAARNARTAGTMNAIAIGVKGVGKLASSIGGSVTGVTGLSGLGGLGSSSGLKFSGG